MGVRVPPPSRAAEGQDRDQGCVWGYTLLGSEMGADRTCHSLGVRSAAFIDMIPMGWSLLGGVSISPRQQGRV